MQVLSPLIVCVMLPGMLCAPWSSAIEHAPLHDAAYGGPINKVLSPLIVCVMLPGMFCAPWSSAIEHAPLHDAAYGGPINKPDWKAPSSATTFNVSTINEQRPSPALCGLGGCATTQFSNPLVFAMQVGGHYSLFSKKTSNYFLVQLPSPQCCLVISVECLHVVHSLLLSCGDIESNPGPDKLDIILDELKKMSSSQTTLVTEVQELKSQLLSMDQKMADFTTRLSTLETHCRNLSTMRTDLEAIQTTTTETTRLVSVLEARLEDVENRSRRNNLIFYGLPDTNPSETYSQSEEIITRHCSQYLDIQLSPIKIERAHRLGRHSQDRQRPIIVKFTSFKTKESVLSKGPKFKDTGYSVGEDFSRRVQNCRKQLIAFAKAKSVSYSLRFKTLHIGPKRYIFYESSETVKETS
ncbi:uncharacterized protein LOC144108732 [Amblyomma americanum]